MRDSVLKDLALNAQLLLAGFAGGVVHVFATGTRDPFKILGTVVSGLLAANYLGGLAAHYLQTVMGQALTEAGAGFIVGFSSIVLINRLSKLLMKTISSKKE